MNTVEPMRVAVVGTGDISGEYLRNAAAFDEFEIVACTDLDGERAARVAGEFGIAATDFAAILDDATIDLVLNLTPPAAHAPVSLEALRAGKHVYSEKPIATTTAAARELVDAAAAAGVSLAGAPDTFLGPPYQEARRMLRDGAIGAPVAVLMSALYKPSESWHPNPEFLYQPGAGPVFDMGPYFLHVLIDLLGPVTRVSALASTPVPERTIATGPLAGTSFQARTPTFVLALLELACGVAATLHASFDVAGSSLPRIEIQGTRASLLLPDPDEADGELLLRRSTDETAERQVTRTAGAHDRRGAGVADQVRAILEGRRPRNAAELPVHALEVMEAILESAQRRAPVDIPQAHALIV